MSGVCGLAGDAVWAKLLPPTSLVQTQLALIKGYSHQEGVHHHSIAVKLQLVATRHTSTGAATLMQAYTAFSTYCPCCLVQIRRLGFVQYRGSM